MRGYKLLTHDDRKTIERMYAAGAKPHLIAEAVGSTLATVYNIEGRETAPLLLS